MDRPSAAEAAKILIRLRDVVENWQPAAAARRNTAGQKLKNMLSKIGSSNGRPSSNPDPPKELDKSRSKSNFEQGRDRRSTGDIDRT